MPIPPLEYRSASSTVRFPWDSADITDAPITASSFTTAHLKVYKDGGTTERTSASGFTATTDFDSKTGAHVAIFDLSDNTDAGFYAAGSEYWVLLDGATVNGITIRKWIGRFVIGNAPANVVQWLGSTPNALQSGRVDSYLGAAAAAVIAAATFAVNALDAVWSTAIRTLTAATNITSTGGTTVPQTGDAYAVVNGGTSGNAALKTLIDAVKAVADAIQAKTDNLPSDPADESLIIAATNSLASAIAALNNLSSAQAQTAAAAALTAYAPATPAQVNAEVVDALNVDTYAEPTGAPPATTSLVRKIGQIYKHLRNKVEQTSSAQTLKNDDGTTDISATVSDDGSTFVRDEWS